MNDAALARDTGLILSYHPRLRLAMVVAFYFTQGVPAALFFLVIPTWLSVNGYSAADIAAVVGAAGTPPAVKFLGGLIVDRFPYLPMGRRKPWILIGQALLCASLIVGALFAGSQPSVALLSVLAFFSLAGTSLQDVSIDSLMIDMFDERERSRASGFTYSAGSLGMAAMIFLGGRLIEAHGLPTVFALLAILPVLVFLTLLPVRERAGERLAPWGKGAAHPHNLALESGSWLAVLRSTLKAMLTPYALLLLALCSIRFVHVGIGDALHPVMATQGAGWVLTRFTDLQTVTTLIAAVAGFAFAGFVLTRTGTRLANLVLLPLTALLYAAMALVPALRYDDTTLTAFFYGYDVLTVCLVVSIFPICMRMCSPGAAATQYALFMAVFNLGRPVGAALVGQFGYEGLTTLLLIVAGMMALSAFAFALVRFPENSEARETPPDPAPVAL